MIFWFHSVKCSSLSVIRDFSQGVGVTVRLLRGFPEWRRHAIFTQVRPAQKYSPRMQKPSPTLAYFDWFNTEFLSGHQPFNGTREWSTSIWEQARGGPWLRRPREKKKIPVGGAEFSRGDKHCCWSPLGIAEQSIIFLLHRDAANSPRTNAPWKERIAFIRRSSPSRRRDMTVRPVQNDWPLLSPPFPCAGGSKTQVTRFTWICWARDKMAEFSPLDRLGSRLNNSSLFRSGVYCAVWRAAFGHG